MGQSASAMNQQSRQNRDSLLLLAAMRFADQPEKLNVKVRNLSPGGMMAEGPVRTVSGERLMVDLRNIGWIGGTVAWVADHRFGVVFDREIDCKAVRRPLSPGDQPPGICVPRPRVGVNEPPPVPPGPLRRI